MSTPIATEQQIREAAFHALVEHGYTDLSIKDIGAESDHDPSLIYHYFDSKDDLLLSMLDVFVDMFVGEQVQEPITDPEAELRGFTDHLLHPTPAQADRVMASPPAETAVAISRVYVELWAHATWDDQYRRRVTAIENRLQTAITHLIRAGVDTGEFQEVDVEKTAELVLSLVLQRLHTRITTDRTVAVETIANLVDETITGLRSET
jgi:AcrR family transcriptional regulator